MSFENLAKDPIFVSGLVLLNHIDDEKFVCLINRMIKDFEPNRLLSFTEYESIFIKQIFKQDSEKCLCLLNSLNCLLKQVISDVTKPVVLKSILSKLFSLDINKIELFCECWTTNAEEIVSRLQQNLIHSYRLKDVNWALNISSNVGTVISNPEPRCLIEFKVEDSLCHNEHKTKEIILDLNEKELKILYDTLETIKAKLDHFPQ